MSPSAAPVLPGYYYDEEKKKYFRALPSNRAPANAKHTAESLKREQRASVKKRKVDCEKRRQNRQQIQRASLTTCPHVSATMLRRAHGQMSNVQQREAQSRALAASLRPSFVDTTCRSDPPRNSAGQFTTVRPWRNAATGQEFMMLATTTSESCQVSGVRFAKILRPPELEIWSPWMASEKELDVSYVEDVHWFAGSLRCGDSQAGPDGTMSVLATNTPSTSSTAPQGPRSTISYKYIRDDWRLECGLGRDYTFPMSTTNALAFNRYNPESHQLIVAFDHGLRFLPSIESEARSSLIHGDDVSPSVSVDWLSANVAIAGMQNGSIHLWDVRDSKSSLRIRHANVLTGVRRAGSENLLVASGLTDALHLYDLRFTSTNNVKPNRKPSARAKTQHRPQTTPLVQFDYSNSTVMGPGSIGLDVHEEAGLVAAAEDTGALKLYSLHTGAALSTRTSPSSANVHVMPRLKLGRDALVVRDRQHDTMRRLPVARPIRELRFARDEGPVRLFAHDGEVVLEYS